MLDLIGRLLTNLNAQEVPYCHWKSNASLTQALSGETDLDLLVQRGSMSQVMDILRQLRFKEAIASLGPRTSGVAHYYGLDERTGRLIHLHLFSQVITGESFVKSHRLPFESMLLKNTACIGDVRVASKPAELVSFILRTYIKYGSLLDLPYLLRDSERLTAELRWLQAGCDISEAARLLSENCPVVDRSLFIRCVNTLSEPRTLVSRIILAQIVRRRLRRYEIHSGFSRGLEYVRLISGEVQRRLARSTNNKVLRSGGRVIAFVGPDATGKSTLVSECRSWLGGVFDVKIVHAGIPPSSWRTLPVNITLPLARRILPRLRTTQIGGYSPSPGSNKSGSGLGLLIYALRATVLAWDRRRLLENASRRAARGEIVMCDRYPSDNVGAMDSPRLHENGTLDGMFSASHNRLARLERRFYEQIPSPDIVLRLSASVETAKRRNRSRKSDQDTDAYLESRHGQSEEWRKAGTKHIYDINTEQPLGETIFSAKRAIWDSL